MRHLLMLGLGVWVAAETALRLLGVRRPDPALVKYRRVMESGGWAEYPYTRSGTMTIKYVSPEFTVLALKLMGKRVPWRLRLRVAWSRARRWGS